MAGFAISAWVGDPPEFFAADGGGSSEGTGGGGVTKAASTSCAQKPAGCADLDGGVAVQCRTGSDCSGGYVCCVRKDENNTGMFATVMCEPSCTGVYTAGQDMFCDPNDPEACPDPESPYCTRSYLLPGMFYCSSE